MTDNQGPSRAYVGNCRVSTESQGRSGLGLEAQQASIRAHLRPGDRLLEPLLIEVESGRKANRPELAKAIQRCRETGATLIVARLDRLARNVAFVSGLMESGIEFMAADMPTVNRLTIHVLAAVAEEEARLVSVRTKAALKAAKARGVVLGGARGGRPPSAEERARGTLAAAEARRRQAQQFKASARETIQALATPGVSLRQLAKQLTAQGVPGPRGGAWNHISVAAVLRQ
jgi:DNA invertase Pin-like site-specific DNA recombinase